MFYLFCKKFIFPRLFVDQNQLSSRAARAARARSSGHFRGWVWRNLCIFLVAIRLGPLWSQEKFTEVPGSNLWWCKYGVYTVKNATFCPKKVEKWLKSVNLLSPLESIFIYTRQKILTPTRTEQRWGQGGEIFILGGVADTLFLYWIGKLLRNFHTGWKNWYHLAIARAGGRAARLHRLFRMNICD